MPDSVHSLFIRAVFVFHAIFLFLSSGSCQEKEKVITLTGYLSTIQSATFDSLSGPFLNENIVHNRLNFKGFLNEKITFAAEFRNRLFTGDMVRYGKLYADLIGYDDGVADLSWNIIEEQSFLLNTTIDRLWLDLHHNKFQLTLGRQRINWGQTFVWNPNDIFNAYSFFDFDYAERPGSDALRLQFFPSSASVAEFAIKAGEENKVTAAALYRFNALKYDFQILSGFMNSEEFVAGAGWSGSVGNMSFRGEGTWFVPIDDAAGDGSTLLVTAGLDRLFKDNSMAQIQFMYCNNPLEFSNISNLYARNFSSKDLAFSEFTAFGQFTWVVMPLLNLSMAAMWFPDLNGYYAGPAVDYSLAQDIGFSFIWQHFDASLNGERSKINQVFLRLKYNF